MSYNTELQSNNVALQEILRQVHELPESGSGELGLEPSAGDIPKVFINGTIPTTKDDVYAEMEYISKTERFKAYLKIKCQGSSSMAYDKKNFTIKLYSDKARVSKLEKTFKDWGHASNKFVLKANYIDHSHARNIVCANLWDEVVSSRSDYGTLPAEMRNSPRNGAIDGFPIKVYTNGTYQGIYTWNIGKDDWMWGMDEDNVNHVLLCGETNTNGVYAETACNFRALWSGTNEDYWSVEVGTNSDAVKNSLNALISCVKDTDDATFKATIGEHLDVQSAIDYFIHQYVICGLDGLAKNMLLATYNGTKWICGAYDMDSTFGLWWDGTRFVSADYRCPEDYQEQFSLLWERIATIYNEEIKARYTELRNTVYSYANMMTQFERFVDTIGKDLYAEDLEVYSGIPCGDINNIKQIRNFIRDRLYYCDMQLGLTEETKEVDYTLNPLADLAWMDGYAYDLNTGEYTAGYGEHCTPKFKLQDCVYEFNCVAAGDYGVVFIWDENGNHIASKQLNSFCFTANSELTYAVKVWNINTFDPEQVSLMPKDNRESMATSVTIALAERTWFVSGRGDVETNLGSLWSNVGDVKVNDLVNSVSGAVLTLNKDTIPWNVAKENDVFIGALGGGGYCYLSTTMFSDVESAMAYFREHNTTITFNG